MSETVRADADESAAMRSKGWDDPGKKNPAEAGLKMLSEDQFLDVFEFPCTASACPGHFAGSHFPSAGVQRLSHFALSPADLSEQIFALPELTVPAFEVPLQDASAALAFTDEQQPALASFFVSFFGSS
jgi:hypothetical protein